MAETGVGYAVLQLRIETLEREIKDIKSEIKEQAKDNAKGFTEINDRVDELATITTEIKVMFANLTQSNKEMKEDIKAIAASAGKDQGWRALITDIIKLLIMLGTFIATGKMLF
jgi:septal ring factor EnvC (AmiA/AmiB activator)